MKQYFHFVFYFIMLQISQKDQHKILSEISETVTGGLLYKKSILKYYVKISEKHLCQPATFKKRDSSTVVAL